MPRKKAPKARFSAREKALLRAAKRAGSDQARERLRGWSAVSDARFPRAD